MEGAEDTTINDSPPAGKGAVEPGIEANSAPLTPQRKPEEFPKISFKIEGLEYSDEDQQKLGTFENGFSDECKKLGLSGEQATGVANFIFDNAKAEYATNVVAQRKEEDAANIAAMEKEMSRAKEFQDYAGQNIGTDEEVVEVVNFTRQFFKDRKMDQNLEGYEKDPKFLHVMAQVRRSLASSSSIERSMQKSISNEEYEKQIYEAVLVKDWKKIGSLRAMAPPSYR